jgi:DNA polymerase-3 subunit delta
MEMMNFNLFDGAVESDLIINASETLPFMSEKRFVLVKDSGLFDTGRKDETDKLKEYVDKIPDTTVVCFVESKVDKRNALYKAVGKCGSCVEYSFMDVPELSRWVCTLANNRIKPTTAEYLIRCVGISMEKLSGEVDKLINYLSEDEEITPSLIDAMCAKSTETKVFELIDAIGRKQPQKALEIYQNMLRAKESPVLVLKLMARQFKIILECSYLSRKNMGERAIAEELGLRPFFIKNYLQQASNFTIPTLCKALEDCAKCDIDFKSGKITDRLGVEVIIMKYSRVSK